MAKRRQSVEIYAPTLGIKADAPPTLLDPRSVPTGQDFKNYYGVHQKEYGTSLYATATVGAVVSGQPMAIFDARYPNTTILEVITPTNVYRYVPGSDSYVNDGQSFIGGTTGVWSVMMYNDAMVYSNGVDPIQVKASYAATGTNMASSISPTTFKAWAINALQEHLCLYHVVENGAEYYKRVRWSKKGVLTYSAGTTDFASGLAGGIDVQDCDGEIKTAVPLQDAIAVYSEHSIHIQYWVGGDEVFKFTKTVDGIGTPSRQGVIGYAGVNYIFSDKNIYAYVGGSDIKPIGNPVKTYLYRELNPAAMASVYVDYNETENEVNFHIPTGTATSPNVVWTYRVPDDAWSRKVRNHTATGKYNRKTGITFGQMKGSFGAQTIRWGDAQVRAESNVILYGDPSGRLVYHDVAKFSLSQTGTDIAQGYRYETPDITGNKAVDPYDSDKSEFIMTDQRWQRISLEALGQGSARVSYSIDQGNTFVEVSQSPITLVPNGTRYLLDIDCVAPYLRVAVSNTGLNEFCGVKYVKLDFIPGAQQ